MGEEKRMRLAALLYHGLNKDEIVELNNLLEEKKNEWYKDEIEKIKVSKMTEPLEMKAGDIRVLCNGVPFSVDYRVIWEENYKRLKRIFDLHNGIVDSLLTDEEINILIYEHLESLPYDGQYPSNWKETLGEYMGKRLRDLLLGT